MNLRGLANGLTQAINPNQTITVLHSAGYTTDAAGVRTPCLSAVQMQAQVQALSGQSLRRINGLSLQGVMRSVYLFGDIQGVVRADQKGGDILQFPQTPGEANQSWRVVHVMETWPEWCHVIVNLQSL